MKFPNLVYRCPGDHHCPGGSYDYLQVINDDQLAEAVDEGWFSTLPEAMEGEHSVDDIPPTREEVEQKAKDLNIQYDKNTKTQTLLDKIKRMLPGEW